MNIRTLPALAIVLLALSACTHEVVREPQAAKPSYNPERVRLLKFAAVNGVLIHIPDKVLRDLPVAAAGKSCRKTEEGPWIDRLYDLLRLMEAEPALAAKIHVIEFRRGDQPQAEISRDLDGAATLLVTYAKVENRRRIEMLTDPEIPCSDRDPALLGQDLIRSQFQWPDTDAILAVLRPAPRRANVDRLAFDHRFPLWLAERMTIFRYNSDLGASRTLTGSALIPTAMGHLSTQIAARPQQPQLEYWLKTISTGSRLGGGLIFFGLFRDRSLTAGIKVDSAGPLARKISGLHDPTYPFLSYKEENGGFTFNQLQDLNACLEELRKNYSSGLTSMTNYEADPDSFLFPGHTCRSQSGESTAPGAAADRD